MTEQNSGSQEGVWARSLGFGERPALLVVDLTLAFTDPSRPLGADATDVIGATNRLLAAAHSAAIPVIFTAVAYDAPDFSDAGLWAHKISALEELRAGGDGVEVDPRLSRAEGDAMLYKKYASCFFGTDLASRLTAQRCDTVVIAGLTTSGCVRATAVDALQCGFRPMVVREAVGDRWPDAHRQSLFDLESKYADVVALDDALREIAGRPRERWFAA